MSGESSFAEDGFAAEDRILAIDIEDTGATSPDLDQERKVAAYDLVEESRLRLDQPVAQGPYRLRLGADGAQLRLSVADASGGAIASLSWPLGELREAVEDYVALCDDYRDAVRRLAPSQIEKIDEARREAHLEGAEALASLFAPAVRMDAQTARRFFTVLCAAVGDLE